MSVVSDVFADLSPRPSERDKADFLHLSHQFDAERFSYLSSKLKAIGQTDLAELSMRWSREHAIVARDLRKRSR